MANNKTTERQLLLKYAVEQATLTKVKAANEQIKQSMLDVGKAAKTGGAVAASEQRRVAKETKLLRGELIDLEAHFHDVGDTVPRELQDIIDKMDNLGKSTKKGVENLRDFDDEFNQVSKDVALAGDVESQARTVGGAVGAFGGAGIEKGVAQGGELFAVVEALPRLKSSLAGMPKVIKGFANSLGTTGLGLTAVVVAAGLAFAKVASDIGKQTALMEGLISAQSDYFEVVATGTVDVAQARIREATAARDTAQAEKELIDARVEAAAASKAGSRDLVDSIASVAIDIQGVFGTNPIEKLQNRQTELNNTIAESNATIATFTRGLEDNAFATETAADTLARLNQAEMERTAIILAGAAEIEQSTIKQRDLMRQSTDQLDSALLDIDDQALGLLASLTALKAADPTPQILEQIAAEELRFGALRQERAFIMTFASEAAAAREAEAAALEDQVKASEEAEAAAQDQIDAGRRAIEVIQETMEKRIALEKKQADELIALSERAAEAEAKVLQQLEDKLGDLNQSLGRDLADQQRKNDRKVLEAQIDAQREQVRQFRDHTRSLEDIRRKADESEFGLRQSRDFKGVANARRTARIQIQDEQRAFARKQEDSAEQLSQEATDRQRSFAEARADRMRKFRQDINDARVAATQQRNEAILAGRQAIMDARAKQRQEILDLQQSGLQKLTVRKQISDAEIQMMLSVAGSATSLLQSMMASFSSFAGAGNTTNNSNSSTLNVGGINVTGQDTNNGDGVASSVIAVLQGVVA